MALSQQTPPLPVTDRLNGSNAARTSAQAVITAAECYQHTVITKRCYQPTDRWFQKKCLRSRVTGLIRFRYLIIYNFVQLLTDLEIITVWNDISLTLDVKNGTRALGQYKRNSNYLNYICLLLFTQSTGSSSEMHASRCYFCGKIKLMTGTQNTHLTPLIVSCSLFCAARCVKKKRK